MIEIKMLKRAFVKKVGVVEAEKKTPAEDDNAIYLVETGHAEYADKKAADAAAKVKAVKAKEAEADQ